MRSTWLPLMVRALDGFLAVALEDLHDERIAGGRNGAVCPGG
jgi:hypothetical protein